MIIVLLGILVIVIAFAGAVYIIRGMGLEAKTQQLALMVVGLICLILLVCLLVWGFPWPAGRVP